MDAELNLPLATQGAGFVEATPMIASGLVERSIEQEMTVADWGTFFFDRFRERIDHAEKPLSNAEHALLDQYLGDVDKATVHYRPMKPGKDKTGSLFPDGYCDEECPAPGFVVIHRDGAPTITNIIQAVYPAGSVSMIVDKFGGSGAYPTDSKEATFNVQLIQRDPSPDLGGGTNLLEGGKRNTKRQRTSRILGDNEARAREIIDAYTKGTQMKAPNSPEINLGNYDQARKYMEKLGMTPTTVLTIKGRRTWFNGAIRSLAAETCANLSVSLLFNGNIVVHQGDALSRSSEIWRVTNQNAEVSLQNYLDRTYRAMWSLDQKRRDGLSGLARANEFRK